MNKTVFYLVAVVMTMFFTACDKNDPISDNESYVLINENPLLIKAYNVENTRSDIASVKMTITYYSSDEEWISLTSTAEYKNDGFELIFPAIIPNEGLFLESKISNKIILSDIEAKTYLLGSTIDAVNRLDEAFGGFNFSCDDWSIIFIYADRDFTAKGTTDYGVEYDCSYKKGWNILYVRWLGGTSYKRTTQKPSNNNIKCHFGEYVYQEY
jgi:hypothetical protein